MKQNAPISPVIKQELKQAVLNKTEEISIESATKTINNMNMIEEKDDRAAFTLPPSMK